ncbi:helix-turn-helix transcriptional regulator [Virgibacillus sp. W0181]|uniref:helix-turn-helix transcriptional regulator n=1 Tax=Virgibacillus sp. W0181 TaxID=3391581 RepID=UPI003F4544DD
MNRQSNYRLLQLRDILFNETDDNHELDINEIQERLQKGTDSFDTRTIKSDLEILDQTEFEIVKNKGKFGKLLYSHQAKVFETYQLRLLVDAILSARFITTNEKNKLIDKLKQLTSTHIAKTLPEPVVFSPSVNMDYDLVKLNIDRVHHAISNKKVIMYQYGRFNVEKKFEYSRDGGYYYVEPYALIWQNDFYYLIGYFQEANELRHYRLDRIRNIGITNVSFQKKAFELQEYIDQSFHMFAGEDIRVKIRFHMNLVNVVLDRFGQEADMEKIDDNHFILTAKAKLSTGLINWILTWGNQAKVLSPEGLVSEVKEKILQMYETYED